MSDLTEASTAAYMLTQRKRPFAWPCLPGKSRLPLTEKHMQLSRQNQRLFTQKSSRLMAKLKIRAGSRNLGNQ